MKITPLPRPPHPPLSSGVGPAAAQRRRPGCQGMQLSRGLDLSGRVAPQLGWVGYFPAGGFPPAGTEQLSPQTACWSSCAASQMLGWGLFPDHGLNRWKWEGASCTGSFGPLPVPLYHPPHAAASSHPLCMPPAHTPSPLPLPFALQQHTMWPPLLTMVPPSCGTSAPPSRCTRWRGIPTRC